MRPSTMARLILLGLILTIIYSLCSCNPGKHMSRFLHRHPELVKTDTVWKRDTILISGIHTDSLFYFYQRDTVFIKEGKLTIKYITNKDSTVYIQGKCDPDTIYKDTAIAVSNVEVLKSESLNDRFLLWLMHNILFVAIGLFIVIVAYKILRKIYPVLP